MSAKQVEANRVISSLLELIKENSEERGRLTEALNNAVAVQDVQGDIDRLFAHVLDSKTLKPHTVNLLTELRQMIVGRIQPLYPLK
jgi:hypothetical protein